MNVYFTRKTHNFNNETREWEYRKGLEELNDIIRAKEKSVDDTIKKLNEAFATIEKNRPEKEYIKIDPYSLSIISKKFGYNSVEDFMEDYIRLSKKNENENSKH